jgi:hypothetical protein
MLLNRDPLLSRIIFGMLLTASASAQNSKNPIRITADLSDAPRKLFHAKLDLPVTAGTLTPHPHHAPMDSGRARTHGAGRRHYWRSIHRQRPDSHLAAG